MNASKGMKEGEKRIIEEEGKLIFGSYTDEEMLAQLKILALDPCDSNVSRPKIRPLWNQMLKVRDAMALADNDISWGMRPNTNAPDPIRTPKLSMLRRE